MIMCETTQAPGRPFERSKARKVRGFTLIEVLIVVAIVAILSAIAYPNYTRYVFRTRRADAKEMLMAVASAEERYYTNFNRYTLTITDLGSFPASGVSEHGYYNVRIVAGPTATTQSYTLNAVPAGLQANDKCLTLTLNNVGVKGRTGNDSNGNCWP